MKLLLDYQTRAGAPAHPPSSWPQSTRIAMTVGEARLVVFAHPHCPCTRATLGELARVMARTEGRLHAAVQFVVPPGEDPQWARTDLWRSAAAIPGVQVGIDQGGAEARRFGSLTSGQVLLYDAAGRLCFAGGITAGRGHAGDNAGEDAIVAIASNGVGRLSSTPVYGCALKSPSTAAERMDPQCPK
ncbi:MAG: hypothetical protein HYR74_00105 [Candidatus Eisenbacteria bacterium]|nr:hypothetical protein [Candidatus Eisenbacteria bacterium]